VIEIMKMIVLYGFLNQIVTDNTFYAKSFDDNITLEVFSTSRYCTGGKINNLRRKKNVAKTTIMNTATIIKIKTIVVFMLINIKNWSIIKLYTTAAI
jgi:hypothetical protein